MKYYLIAGEASGDLHASMLMEAIKVKDPDASFRFFGGDLMQKQGGQLVKHYRDMAFMGFLPVLMNLRTIFRNMRQCKEDVAASGADVLILIDYPSFNLSIAKFVKQKLGIPVFYYISPKIWAWKEWRIKDIKKYVDEMFCILPFEVDFYKKHNYRVEYIGNPTVDELRGKSFSTKPEFIKSNNLDTRPIIALLAGSRQHEVRVNLPLMIESASAFPDYQMVLAGAPGLDMDFYKQIIGEKKVNIVFDQTFDLLHNSRAALVTSGTATLETAVMGVPQVVCYNFSGGMLVYNFMKAILNVRRVSLVNLIVNEDLVKELLGPFMTAENLRHELSLLLEDSAQRQRVLQGYDRMNSILGETGAPMKAAERMIEKLRK